MKRVSPAGVPLARRSERLSGHEPMVLLEAGGADLCLSS